jgi:hypothetical protein
VHRLLEADWEGEGSAVQVNASLALDELEPSTTLHNARLFLALLAEMGTAKATPKGNLPRAFVAAFHERMRWAPDTLGREWLAERKIINEDDLTPLHLQHVLLQLAGLIKRRKGNFSLTRRGQQHSGAERAGALFATLFRTYFRVFNLAYLDGYGPVPGLQRSIAFTLHRFGQVGGEWRRADDLTRDLVLPAVLAEVPPPRYSDPLPNILRLRVLNPLEGFALAEMREIPRAPGEWGREFEYRKGPLFGRVLRFEV